MVILQISDRTEAHFFLGELYSKKPEMFFVVVVVLEFLVFFLKH